MVKKGVYGYADKNGNTTFDLAEKDEEVRRIIKIKIQEAEEEEDVFDVEEDDTDS